MLEKHNVILNLDKFYKSTLLRLKKNAYSIFISFFTALYALKASVVTVVAVSALPFIAPLALPYLIPLLLLVFMVEFVICIYLHRQALSDTLKSIFVTGIFNKELEDSAHSQTIIELKDITEENSISTETLDDNQSQKAIFIEFTPKQKAWMIIGGICAAATSLAIASYGYLSVINLISMIAAFFSLSVLPPVAITIAIVLAVIGFVVFGALLLDKIRQAIVEDAHHQVAQFFLNLIPQNSEKPFVQQLLESVFKILLLLLAIGLGLLALVVTLGTLNKKLIALFSLIPAANEMACKIASGIIVYGLAACAKLPWVIRSLGIIATTVGEAIGYSLFFLTRKIAYFFYGSDNLNIKKAIKTESKDTTVWEQLSLKEKFYFVSGKLIKIIIVLFSGFIAVARAAQGGSETLEDIYTALAPPGDTELIENVANATALGAAATFHLCTGGYALFFQENEKKSDTHCHKNYPHHQKNYQNH